MHGMDEVLDNGGEEQVLQIGHKETELQTLIASICGFYCIACC